jgi:hypothetical protein
MSRPAPTTVDQEQAFALLRRAWPLLRAYQDRIVLAGGLAKLAYTHHPLFRQPAFAMPPTGDVDLALPFPLDELDGLGVLDHLAAGGLHVDHGNGDEQAITRVFTEPDAVGGNAPYIEFLTPPAGRDKRREGQPQPALRAHIITSARLLLTDPDRIDVPGIGPVPVPHPLAYSIQKTYIRIDRHSRRPLEKRRKDQADMLFVLNGFRERWDEMAERWRRIRTTSTELAAWSTKTFALWQQLYARPDSEGPVEVADAYRSMRATVDPVAVHAIMTAFLRRLAAT